MERSTSNTKIGFVGGFVNAAFSISAITLVCVGYFSAIGQIVQVA